MIFNKTGTPLEGKPRLSLLSDIENELGNNWNVIRSFDRSWRYQGVHYAKLLARGVGPRGASR